MTKKIKSSLLAKVFLTTSAMLLCMSLLVFGISAWFMPQTYSNRLNMILDERTKDFISELEQVSFSNSGGLFGQFIVDMEINSVELYNSNGDWVSLPTEEFDNEWGEGIAQSTASGSGKASPILSNSYYFSFSDSSNRYMLIVYGEAEQIAELQQSFIRVFPIVLLIILAIAFIVSWLYSRMITKPVLSISHISEKMSALQLDWKVDERRTDELAILLISSMAACGAHSTLQNPLNSDTSLSNEVTSIADVSGVAEYNGDGSETITEEEKSKRFHIYEECGMMYDAAKNELSYNGKLVRWFEDYYPLDETGNARIDFFNENGIVDVYAVRDFTAFERDSDGAIDLRGKLVGLKEFTQQEFDARDVDAIKNPTSQSAVTGEQLTSAELNVMLSEYKDFGVTYDEKTNQWFFNGEKVRYFRDVLTSNGESLNSGKFHGTLRTLESGDGTIDIYTVRDFGTPNSEGYGTLTGIETYSQKEFNEHTNAQSSNNNYSTSATGN